MLRHELLQRLHVTLTEHWAQHTFIPAVDQIPAEQERFVRSPLIVTGLPRLEKTREWAVELLHSEFPLFCVFLGFL